MYGPVRTVVWEGRSRKAPPYPDQSTLCGARHNVELGAAWQKTAKDTERDYLSVKLDDPSFPAPIYATLIEVEGQEGLQLIWSRPNRD